MGAIGNMVTGMLARARRDAGFRQELQADTRKVLEREIGRKLSDEEFEAARAELEKQGLGRDKAAS